MVRNILQRLLQSLLVLFGCALMIFIMLRIIPGNPIAVLMGEHADVEVIRRMTSEFGLDQPVIVQFFRYLGGALRGDFGTSYSFGRPVFSLMASAFVNTLILALLAALFAWTLGIVCGIIAAVKKNSIPDRLFMGASLFGVSMPVFMAAMLLQYFLAYKLKLFGVYPACDRAWMEQCRERCQACPVDPSGDSGGGLYRYRKGERKRPAGRSGSARPPECHASCHHHDGNPAFRPSVGRSHHRDGILD